jgi:hypothetical protein
MKKPALTIILGTCITALIFAAGIIIHVAYGQIAELSLREINQIATDNKTKNSDNNDNRNFTIRPLPLTPPPTNITVLPSSQAYVIYNGSLFLVNATSGELINATTTAAPLPQQPTTTLTPTPQREPIEEPAEVGGEEDKLPPRFEGGRDSLSNSETSELESGQ